jgi:Tol biopolymer transport system component
MNTTPLVAILIFSLLGFQCMSQTKSKKSLLSEQQKINPKLMESWVPIRPITKGPKHHWFGYYDKLQFDPTNRYVLAMQVDFQNRSPGKEDVIKIGMIDLKDNDRWIELGESRAWNWQQGCMLQWIPGTESTIIWNDREEDKFVAHILDVKTKEKRTINTAIYALSPDGKTAVTTDFERIQLMRPGYGYAGIPDINQDKRSPNSSGIYKVNLETGGKTLIITYEDMLKIPHRSGDISQNKHYFNHLLFSPDGKRFVFLNRWRINEFRPTNPTTPFDTRMITANLDGEDLRVMDDYGYTSHFIWRDNEHVLAWARHPSHGDKFYLYKDDGSVNPKVVAPDIMLRNGHCSYLPGKGNTWILNDTYPDENRLQNIYLYHVKKETKVPLANLYLSPDFKFDSELRVDTHPRFSRDGKMVVVDSPHEGYGRQMYLLDISKIVKD